MARQTARRARPPHASARAHAVLPFLRHRPRHKSAMLLLGGMWRAGNDDMASPLQRGTAPEAACCRSGAGLPVLPASRQ